MTVLQLIQIPLRMGCNWVVAQGGEERGGVGSGLRGKWRASLAKLCVLITDSAHKHLMGRSKTADLLKWFDVLGGN